MCIFFLPLGGWTASTEYTTFFFSNCGLLLYMGNLGAFCFVFFALYLKLVGFIASLGPFVSLFPLPRLYYISFVRLLYVSKYLFTWVRRQDGRACIIQDCIVVYSL